MSNSSLLKRPYPFVLLSIALIVTPFNVPLLLGLRLNDLVLIPLLLVAILELLKVRRWQLLITMCGIVFALSAFAGWSRDLSLHSRRLIFLYKYALPVLLPAIILRSDITDHQRVSLARFMFWGFLFLVSWVFVFFALESLGIIDPVYDNRRPSFPALHYEFSDAHLYSFFLSTGLILFLGYWRRKLRISATMTVMVGLLSIASILMTGSRTGVLVLLAYAGLLLLRFLPRFVRQLTVRARIVGVATMAALVILAVVTLGNLNPAEMTFLPDQARRAFTFGLLPDTEVVSNMGRVRKLGVAINETRFSGHLFGVSPLYSDLTWYDGAVSILLAHFGFVGIAIVVTGLVALGVLIVRRVTDQAERYYLVSLLLVVVAASLITEFFLVTRGILYALVTAILWYQDASKSTIHSVNGRSIIGSLESS